MVHFHARLADQHQRAVRPVSPLDNTWTLVGDPARTVFANESGWKAPYFLHWNNGLDSGSPGTGQRDPEEIEDPALYELRKTAPRTAAVPIAGAAAAVFAIAGLGRQQRGGAPPEEG